MTQFCIRLAAAVIGMAATTARLVAAEPAWESANVLTTGALFENVAEAPTDSDDIAEIRTAQTDEALWLRIEFAGPRHKGHQWGTFVLFDTDLNRRTGFTAGPLGVDYLAQVQGDEGSTLLVHHRKTASNDANFQGWEPQKEVASAITREDRGDTGWTMTLRIPWPAIGVPDRQHAALRFRLCESSPNLDAAHGEWSPDLPEGFFSIGPDPRSMANLPNVLAHGDFDAVNTALATQTPTGWVVHDPGGHALVTAVPTDSGGHALHLAVKDKDIAGANGTPFPARRGVVTFRYKIDRSSVDGRNLGLHLIGLRNDSGLEGYRVGFTPPARHVADGQWHRASLAFRLPSGVGQAMVAPRVNENAPEAGAGDWTLDDVQAYVVPEGISVGIANVWVKTPRLREGETTDLSAFVENGAGRPVEGFTAELHATGPVRVETPTRRVATIAGDGFERLTWRVTATGVGPATLHVSLKSSSGAEDDTGDGVREADYRMLAVRATETIDRAEVNTDEKGFWRRLPRPSTLQVGNAAPLTAIPHKRSADIGHNPYGICTQIPRERDYEKPFDASHLLDADPQTCWSSLQRSSTFPGDPPTVTVRLARTAEVRRINLIPYWNNTDFPRGFRVRAANGGTAVQDALVVQNYELLRDGERRGDKFVQAFPLPTPVRADTLTFTFDRLPRANGNYAEVSTGFKARLSGIDVIDADGRNVALPSEGATAEASDTFTGWQNTAENIRRYYKQIFELGVKWVRIGQWGDQTEWAAVERRKGEFAMDKDTDAAIRELAANGIDVLYGLLYGNHLYNDVNDNPSNKPWMDMGPIFAEGSPFNVNSGPRTKEARQAFVRYVDYVVRRYHDQVKYWELWNEENGWYPGHEADLYGELLAAVGKRIKEIDPTARLSFGGTAAPAPQTTGIALDHGGAPYVDIAAFHPYGIDKPEGGMGTMELYKGNSVAKSKAETGWNTLEQVLDGVRAPFAKHGRPNVEVWMNEFGTNVSGKDYVYDPGIGEFASAKWLMRMYIYGAWNDSRSAWWALHTDNRSQDWGILDPVDFTMRPMALALRNICSTMSDLRPIKDPIATIKPDRSDAALADPKCISFARDGDNAEVLTAVWSAEPVDDRFKEYRRDFELRSERRPHTVEVIDLYWGLRQEAKWDWADGRLRVAGLVLRDYPVVVRVK